MDADGNQCHKPIEDVKVGDMVWAYDEETGENAWKPVVRLFRNESKDWTGVTVNGLEIVSTPGHKYYLPETKKWVPAEDLKVGVKVLLSDGSYGIIEAVRAIHYDKPQTTYNFEVSDFHTYYVGSGVCVHNKGCSEAFIEHDTYNKMRNTIGKDGSEQFINAMDKGIVGPKGQNGIKVLSGKGAQIGGTLYQYEVKVFGQFANYRLYGNYSKEMGMIVFNYFGKALH